MNGEPQSRSPPGLRFPISFSSQRPQRSPRFADPRSGEEVEATLPAAALRVLAAALAQMAEGNPVTLVPLQAELSTQQAAN